MAAPKPPSLDSATSAASAAASAATSAISSAIPSGADIGQFIREQRQHAKLSLRRLAADAGVSNPYLSQIERGLRKPSAEILQQLAKGLRISAEQLYVQAGLLEDRGTSQAVEAAIVSDVAINERQKRALLDIYASFVAESRAAAEADGIDLADASLDGGKAKTSRRPAKKPTKRAAKRAAKKTAKKTAKQTAATSGTTKRAAKKSAKKSSTTTRASGSRKSSSASRATKTTKATKVTKPTRATKTSRTRTTSTPSRARKTSTPAASSSSRSH